MNLTYAHNDDTSELELPTEILPVALAPAGAPRNNLA